MSVVALVLVCLAIGACSVRSTTVEKEAPAATRTYVADPVPAQSTTTTTTIGIAPN